MKKLFSMILAIAMVLSLSATVLAAPIEELGSITIVTPTASDYEITGRLFNAYKLFSTNESYEADGKIYFNYVAEQLVIDAIEALNVNNTEWHKEPRTNQDYVEYVESLRSNSTGMAAFGTKLADLIADDIEAVADPEQPDYTTLKYTYQAQLTGNGKQAGPVEVPFGYYVVVEDASKTPAGYTPMVFAMETAKDMVITLKASEYELEKTEVDVNGAIKDAKDKDGYSIGDTVYYNLASKTPQILATTTKAVLTLKDVMTAGLTYNNDIESFTIGADTYAVPIDAAYAEAITYELKTDGFELIIDFLKLKEAGKEYAEGTKIEVFYSATVNANALQGKILKNTATLQFSNNPNDPMESEVTVYTYGFGFNKVNPDGDLLVGAEFELYAGNSKLYFNKVTKTEGDEPEVTTVTYVYAGTEAKDGLVSTLTTEDGKYNIWGLKQGVYTLKETLSPLGYNLLTGDVTVTIGEDGAVTYNYADKTEALGEGVITFNVLNVSGVELPGTGGMGTAMFTILGTIIMAGAAFVLVINRKRIFNV